MYANKLYHAFEIQSDSNGDRVFQAANSGLVLESFHFKFLDPLCEFVSPILMFVVSDASHQGHVSRHPL
jgi:hypothetical protein